MENRLSKFLKNVRKEKWLMLFCLVLAFLAWQGIRGNIGFEVSISNIDVDVDVPPDWAVWEKSVHRVNILFRGSREEIRYLNNEQLRVVIPMTDPVQGKEMVVRLSAKYLKNPTGAKVVRFSPSEIVVKLDRELAFFHQVLVQDVKQLQKRHVLVGIRHGVVFECAGHVWTGLAPHLQVDRHRIGHGRLFRRVIKQLTDSSMSYL
jgi:hypothetical protein